MLKRILNSILFIFVIVSFLSLNIDIFASDDEYSDGYSNDFASYRVDEEVDSYNLGYGVQYHRDIANIRTNVNDVTIGNAAGSGGGGPIEIGKTYQNQVNVLEINPNEDVELVPYALLQGGTWCTSTVRNAVADYEEHNPGYKVVAAINGDYFQINEACKASTGVTIGQGEYYKATSSHGNVNTLAIRNNGSGKQLFSSVSTNVAPTLTFYDEDGAEIKKIAVNKINEEPADGEVAVYYAIRPEAYQNKIEYVNVSNAWHVELPICAVTTIQGSFYGKGTISKFNESEELLLSGKFAIKTNNSEIDSLLAQGVTVRCQYEYTDEALQDVDNYIGYAFKILENGAVQNNDKYRHPRTMIGQREDGTMILTVIDGRQPGKEMYGASCVEMAALMQYYGCVDAWNLDGGGSSTMLVRKQSGWGYTNGYNDKDDCDWYVTNSPSDVSERSDGNCLLVVAKSPLIEFEVERVTESSIIANIDVKSMVDQYDGFYAMVDGKPYPINNGKATLTNLEPGTECEVYVYGKKGDNYLNLMQREFIKTAFLAPTEVSVKFGITERNDKVVIEIFYEVDNSDGLTNIGFRIDDKKFGSSSLTNVIAQSKEFYDQLNDIEIEIIVKLSKYHDLETLYFDEFKVSYDSSFILNEMDYKNDNLFNSIFVPEYE